MTGHGTLGGYQAHVPAGDYCEPCRKAMAAAKAAYRRERYLRGPLMIPSAGTRRRVQALARMGWPSKAIGQRLGVSSSAVAHYGEGPVIHRDTAARVAALYDLLWDRPGPSRRVSMYAARNGWPSPLAWDDDTIDDPKARPILGDALRRAEIAFDEIAIERAMRGYPVHLRPAERREAVARLTDLGLSAAQIAQRIGKTPRSVTRIRTGARAS